MHFANPICLTLAFLAVLLVWLMRKRHTAVGHSQVSLHRKLHLPLVSWIPALLLTLAWATLCVALACPVLPYVKEKQTIDARDFIITTDISASMWSPLSDPAQIQFANNNQQNTNGNATDSSAQPQQQPKCIDAAVQAIKIFVARRHGDRVALFVFDTDTYYHWPLTSDMKIILEKADFISQRSGGGTNFEGPSDMNPGMGPLQAGIDHFKKYGKAKTKVLIIVTDGQDSISAKRMDELQAQMEALKIRIYALGVGNSWTQGSQSDLKTFVERMGGVVIPVGDAQQMRDGMDKIDQLEKSKVILEKQVSNIPNYRPYIITDIILWFLFIASATFFRENI